MVGCGEPASREAAGGGAILPVAIRIHVATYSRSIFPRVRAIHRTG